MGRRGVSFGIGAEFYGNRQMDLNVRPDRPPFFDMNSVVKRSQGCLRRQQQEDQSENPSCSPVEKLPQAATQTNSMKRVVTCQHLNN